MRLSALAACSLAVSCAHNVPQDKATSADGKIKGAKALVLQDNAAKDSGIVTYPGGDRVDWKVIDLPDKKRGTLDVTLSWTPPRPGLKLAFDVFDAWNNPVAASSKKAKGRNRTASVDNAKGKYFIRVYAVGRGDAGKYKLAIEFKEGAGKSGGIDWLAIPIDNPPKLADLPGVVIPCDQFNPDTTNPECKKICWQGAPANWPGCAGTCVANPPDPNNPVCARESPCPSPPDRKFKKCPKSVFGKCKDPKNPDPANPNCDGITLPPIAARVGSKSVVGGETEVLIMVGKDGGVGDDWSATLLAGDSGKPLTGGSIKIIRVDRGTTTGRVKLTPDQVDQNKNVRLTPPPAPKP